MKKILASTLSLAIVIGSIIAVPRTAHAAIVPYDTIYSYSYSEGGGYITTDTKVNNGTGYHLDIPLPGSGNTVAIQSGASADGLTLLSTGSWLYGERVGWISLSGSGYTTSIIQLHSTGDSALINSPLLTFTGYAWSTTAGYIQWGSGSDFGVYVYEDSYETNKYFFAGATKSSEAYAYGEGLGFIKFTSPESAPPSPARLTFDTKNNAKTTANGIINDSATIAEGQFIKTYTATTQGLGIQIFDNSKTKSDRNSYAFGQITSSIHLPPMWGTVKGLWGLASTSINTGMIANGGTIPNRNGSQDTLGVSNGGSGMAWTENNDGLKVIKFDGIDDQLFSNAPSLGITGALTIGAWVKFTDQNSGAIISKIGASSGYSLTTSPTGNIEFTINPGHTTGATISGPLANATGWNFITATADGTQRKLYLNSELITSGTQNSNLDAATENLLIGSGSNGSTFSGSLSMPFMTANAISETQIQNLYDYTKYCFDDDLITPCSLTAFLTSSDNLTNVDATDGFITVRDVVANVNVFNTDTMTRANTATETGAAAGEFVIGGEAKATSIEISADASQGALKKYFEAKLQTGVTTVHIYDTTKDTISDEWRDTFAPAFPQKAVLVVMTDGIDVYDIETGISSRISNITNISSVTALNGRIYAAHTGGIAVLDYINSSENYNESTTPALFNNNVHDIDIQIFDGRTLIAAATDSGITVIDETNSQVTKYASGTITNTTYQKISFRADGTLTAFNSAGNQTDIWFDAQNNITDQTTADKTYTTVNNVKDLTTGDGKTYAATDDGLRVISGTSTGNTTVQKYTTDHVTPPAHNDGLKALWLNGKTEDVSATKLLLHFDGPNGGTGGFVDNSDSKHQITNNSAAGGIANYNTTIKAFTTGSSIFVNNAGKMQIPVSDDWNLNSGDFSIDLYAQFSNAAGIRPLVGQWNNDGTNNAFRFYYNGTNLALDYTTDGTTTITKSFAAWTPTALHHIALERDGTSLRAYVDGLQIGADTSIGTAKIYNSSRPLTIAATGSGQVFGNASAGTYEYFNGYIDELRIVKGKALWKAPFTTPTAPYAAYDAGNIIKTSDKSGNSHNPTIYGNPTIKTLPSGVETMSFDGTDDYLDVGTTNFGGDTTIGAWAKFKNNNAYERIIDFGNGAGNGNILLARNNIDSAMVLQIYTGAANTYSSCFSSAGTIINNEMAYFVFTWKGGEQKIYKNGQSIGTCTLASAIPTISRTKSYIGKSNWSDPAFEGDMSNVFVLDSILTPDQVLAEYNATKGCYDDDETTSCSLTQTLAGKSNNILNTTKSDNGFITATSDDSTTIYRTTTMQREAAKEARVSKATSLISNFVLEKDSNFDTKIKYFTPLDATNALDTNLKYQISADNGRTWFYHNGSAWQEATKSDTIFATTAETLNANLKTFVSEIDTIDAKANKNKFTVRAISADGTAIDVKTRVWMDYGIEMTSTGNTLHSANIRTSAYADMGTNINKNKAVEDIFTASEEQLLAYYQNINPSATSVKIYDTRKDNIASDWRFDSDRNWYIEYGSGKTENVNSRIFGNYANTGSRMTDFTYTGFTGTEFTETLFQTGTGEWIKTTATQPLDILPIGLGTGIAISTTDSTFGRIYHGFDTINGASYKAQAEIYVGDSSVGNGAGKFAKMYVSSSAGTSAAFIIGSGFVTSTGSWLTKTITFDTVDSQYYLHFYNEDSTANSKIYIRNIQIVRTDTPQYLNTTDRQMYVWNPNSTTMTGHWAKYATTTLTDTHERGGMKAFPEIAVLVSSGSHVKIYDAVDGALWRTYAAHSGIITLAAINGKIYAGTNTGINIYDWRNETGSIIHGGEIISTIKTDIINNNEEISYTGSGGVIVNGAKVENGIYAGISIAQNGDAWTISGSTAVQKIGGAVDGNDKYTKLLLKGEDFTDSSASAHAISSSGTITTGKYGNAMTFSGTYATVPYSPDLNFGTGDFTIDTWVNLASSTTTQAFVSQGYDIPNFWTLYTSGTLIRWYNSVNDISITPILSTGTWYHVAVVRKDGISSLYLDGARGTSVADTVDYNFIGVLYVGRDYNGFPLQGSLDELRISKGIARWTEDFTPPTREYSDTSRADYTRSYSAGNTPTNAIVVNDTAGDENYQVLVADGSGVRIIDNITKRENIVYPSTTVTNLEIIDNEKYGKHAVVTKGGNYIALRAPDYTERNGLYETELNGIQNTGTFHSQFLRSETGSVTIATGATITQIIVENNFHVSSGATLGTGTISYALTANANAENPNFYIYSGTDAWTAYTSVSGATGSTLAVINANIDTFSTGTSSNWQFALKAITSDTGIHAENGYQIKYEVPDGGGRGQILGEIYADSIGYISFNAADNVTHSTAYGVKLTKSPQSTASFRAVITSNSAEVQNITVNRGAPFTLSSNLSGLSSWFATYTWSGADVTPNPTPRNKTQSFNAPNTGGTLPVTLKVANNDGDSTTLTLNVNVNQLTVNPTASGGVAAIQSGSAIIIDAGVTSPELNETLTYTWSLADTNSGTITNDNTNTATFTGTAAGTNIIYINVADGGGPSVTGSITMSVRDTFAPLATYSGSNLTLNTGSVISLNTGLPNGDAICTWSMTASGDTLATLVPKTGNGGCDSATLIPRTASGEYAVTLKVTDTLLGSTQTRVYNITAGSLDPFTAAPLSVVQSSNEVTLTADRGDAGSQLLTYEWSLDANRGSSTGVWITARDSRTMKFRMTGTGLYLFRVDIRNANNPSVIQSSRVYTVSADSSFNADVVGNADFLSLTCTDVGKSEGCTINDIKDVVCAGPGGILETQGAAAYQTCVKGLEPDGKVDINDIMRLYWHTRSKTNIPLN